MGKVIVQKYTTINPISMIGEEAGICWNADTSDNAKNYKRGIGCLKSGHMRTAEFPQVYLILDGYSARVIRELYTHIAGGPTRLQASTRYIDYEHGFGMLYPDSVKNNLDNMAWESYIHAIKTIGKSLQELDDCGVPREDSANLLPLGMETKIVFRTNLRHLIDMSHQRLCNRAYWEFRQLIKDVMKELSEYSEEWKTIVDEYFKPKCDVCGYCEEAKGCGRRPSKERIDELIQLGLKYEKELNE